MGAIACPATQEPACVVCLSRPHQMEGWLTITSRCQSVRFHSDRKQSGSAKNVLVIVDHVKEMPAGDPPLLRTRRNMRYKDAVALWKELQRCGWTVAEPAWGSQGPQPLTDRWCGIRCDQVGQHWSDDSHPSLGLAPLNPGSSHDDLSGGCPMPDSSSCDRAFHVHIVILIPWRALSCVAADLITRLVPFDPVQSWWRAAFPQQRSWAQRDLLRALEIWEFFEVKAALSNVCLPGPAVKDPKSLRFINWMVMGQRMTFGILL